MGSLLSAMARNGPLGFQKWRSLLFLHWLVPVETLRGLVPAPLEVDTFNGRAYSGIVAFTTDDVRSFRRLPPLPTARAFHETNVRTYVRHPSGEPGIWFFSLEAASAVAVIAARIVYHLPYFRAHMSLHRDGPAVHYRSRRLWPTPVPALLDVRYAVGEARGNACPGTLEHFLVERYVLYTRKRDGTLLRARVRHEPYLLRAAEVLELDESLMAAAGVPSSGEHTPALFSPGVDVDVFAPEPQI